MISVLQGQHEMEMATGLGNARDQESSWLGMALTWRAKAGDGRDVRWCDVMLLLSVKSSPGPGPAPVALLCSGS